MTKTLNFLNGVLRNMGRNDLVHLGFFIGCTAMWIACKYEVSRGNKL